MLLLTDQRPKAEVIDMIPLRKAQLDKELKDRAHASQMQRVADSYKRDGYTVKK